MRSRSRSALRALVPPALVRGVRGVGGVRGADSPPEFQVGTGHRIGGGWAVEDVAHAYRTKWPAFLEAVRGPGPLGVAHEVMWGTEMPRDSISSHHTIITLGYVLSNAARGRDRLSVLDWGGALGQHYVLAKELLPGLELEWHCEELPAACEAGRELLPEVKFYAGEESLRRSYDLVLASSALQYSPHWREALGRLGASATSYLYVGRQPVTLSGSSFAALQRAHAYGYGTEYEGWVLDRSLLLAAAEHLGFELVREFLTEEGFWVSERSEDIWYRGFLWRPRGAGDDG